MDAGKRSAGELGGWPTANCRLVTRVVMKWRHPSFKSYKTAPVTFESYTLNPGQKLSIVYKINLLI